MKRFSRITGLSGLLTAACLFVALALSLGSVNATAQTTRGLQAWWKMDEGTGARTADASGRGNAGIVAGAPPPSWTSGVSSNGLFFEGNGASFVVVAGSRNLGVISNAITVAAWVRPVSFNAHVVTKWLGNGATDGSWILSVTQGKAGLELFLNGVYTPLPGNTVWSGDGEWHHIAGTYDGSTMSVYLDGSFDGSRSASGKIDIVNASLFLGQQPDGSFPYEGDMDNVRIYNRALTAAEILQLFQSKQ